MIFLTRKGQEAQEISNISAQISEKILDQSQEAHSAHEKEGDFSAQLSEDIKIHDVLTWMVQHGL